MISPCKNQALSEDYADFIIGRLSPFPESIASLEGLCRAPMTISQLCMYAPLSNVLPLSINHYPYSSIPSLFTLEDTTPLEASGILRLQNQPVLQLKGQGTVIGIIDIREIESFGNIPLNKRIKYFYGGMIPPYGVCIYINV